MSSIIGIKIVAILYPGVLIAHIIGQSFGKLLKIDLWILGLS